ncbi:hypothetical protein B5E77_00100 [Lachnoclostridium sp. An131]|uniref:dihydrolipoamide acetyltransferase family protein n=1 Tax=Lachnoclostridium sp. An131 TaxID=1965555 RepID=UPI000B396A5A|nr:dihydrolipoamide acetyltransferase family protein [Lachnoclostridium sp. An131]OUQ28808.1 hypothetical protein B5E77_00100 [Lachnoclostridium sp. An131]
MATKVIVPSEGGDLCVISECVVAVGDRVCMGDLICSVETDKAMVDVSAPCDGVVLAILYQEGDEVKAFEPIAVIGEEGEKIEKEDTGKEEPVEEMVQIQRQASEKEKMKEEKPGDKREEVLVSPRARRYAEKHQVSLKEIVGTGIFGSITEKDVAEQAAHTEESEEKGYRVRMLSRMEQASGRHVMESLQQSAQFTLTMRVCADRLLELRTQLKENRQMPELASVTVNDLFCFAAARTLLQFPRLNAVWNGEELREYDVVNLGIAVDSGEGLVVPVVSNADRLSLYELSRRSHELAERCRAHIQSAEDLKGATFSITNLGKYGIEVFTPILNVPQTAILGIGAPVGRLVLDHGQIRETKEIMLSLTLDHRAVDGALGAAFMQALKMNVECMDILLVR